MYGGKVRVEDDRAGVGEGREEEKVELVLEKRRLIKND